ncbi:MAG: sulfate permease [Lachnospiraceae bacterium]|nr:sulfate permease [Lachnospiraceae bacterium]
MDKLKPKLFSVMKNYSKEQLIKDIVAGIIVAIVALPLSIALAIASGVSPEQGLHTAIIAGFFISFLGGSRVQIGGPTAAFVMIIYGIVKDYSMDGLILATLMAGAIMILMGLLRLGTLIKFIPTTITVGFTAGIAVSIFVQQIKDFTGITLPRDPEDFIDRISLYAQNMDGLKPQTVIIGVIALVILIVWPKITQKIPGPLVAIIVTTVIVAVTDMDVATIGSAGYEVSSKLPTPSLPSGITFATVKNLISPAFTIALLAAIESLLSCVVSDGMIGSKHRSNMELIGQGVGNMASALFGGIPATGAIARTATNVKNGGRTPIAGMVHSLTLLLIMLVFMPYAKLIPMTTLAAVLMMVAYNMSGWRDFKALLKAPKSDIVVLLATFFLTVFFDLVVAIEVGMVLAALLFMNRMAQETTVREWEYTEDGEDDENDKDAIGLRRVPKKTAVFEINGPMFFGAADKFVDIVRDSKDGTKVIILRMRSVSALDATAFGTLKKIYLECKKMDITLILSHVNEQPMKVMKKNGFDELIGEDNFAPHIDEAIERAKALAG